MKKRPRRQLPYLCRICLTGSSSMQELSAELDSDNSENITILNALQDVMCCEIIVSKSTPNHICSMCMSLLRISYNLKVQFRETQNKLFFNGDTQELDSNCKVSSRKCESEVEIIVGNEKYSLKDILIVEDDENTEDFEEIIENLGKAVTIEYVGNKLDEMNDDSFPVNLQDDMNNKQEFDECETIIIQTLSDEELSPVFLEHEYPKHSNDNGFMNAEMIRQCGRKSKYPLDLMKKIESLIIEGDADVDPSSRNLQLNHDPDYDIISESKDHQIYEEDICRNIEVKDIEKYIIYGSGPETFIDPEREKSPEVVENKEISKTSSEIHSASTDQLFIEASQVKNKCPQCTMFFATRSGLRSHLHFVHKRKDIMMRKSKHRISKQAKLGLRAQGLKHNFKKNPLLCQICGYVSKSAGGARYHLLTHGEKMYPCELCAKKFYTPSHLKNHFQSKHEGKKSKHLCPLCGEHRNSATALSYHMKLHTDEAKKFSCPICGIKFLVKSALNTHIRRHNGDRRFPCDKCHKAFFSTNELKKHRMTHTGERPYKCDYCDKKFVTPFNQKMHMTTHEGPYLCEYCNKGCIDLDMLNIHLKHKHRTCLSYLQNWRREFTKKKRPFVASKWTYPVDSIIVRLMRGILFLKLFQTDNLNNNRRFNAGEIIKIKLVVTV
ncbi:hypothetical protein WA026_020058 [Henosepilachna vigintioctopunctata]